MNPELEKRSRPGRPEIPPERLRVKTITTKIDIQTHSEFSEAAFEEDQTMSRLASNVIKQWLARRKRDGRKRRSERW